MPNISKILTIDLSPEQFLNNCSPLELKEIDTLIQSAHYVKRMESQTCRSCGCTDYDCRKCIEKTGKPCYWFGKNLCSACAATTSKVVEFEFL